MRDDSLCSVLQKLLSLAKHNYGTNKVRYNNYFINFTVYKIYKELLSGNINTAIFNYYF